LSDIIYIFLKSQTLTQRYVNLAIATEA